MKTLNEKVKSLMDFIGTDCAEDKKAIEQALKEQDRDTRHACAEAVTNCGSEVAIDGMRELLDVDIACISITDLEPQAYGL